ncbi:BZIP-type transcription factor [Xylariaceae sp. FL0662B]|nr:BZIP-type transcription factor [Xylariaceae sp. FL0662B]
MTDRGSAARYPTPPTHYSPSDHKPSLGSLYEHVSMSSSPSPLTSHGGAQPGGPSGSGSEKGPLSSLNLNFLKSLNDKKTTREGNPQKRRGPKPDSRPALTRRQELNRQAQRTHRERKELYIKALEDEVLRLKEVYSNVSQDKDKLAEENRQLRSLLQQNGISGVGMDDVASNPSLGYPSSGSISGSYAQGSNTAYTPPLTSVSTAPSACASSQAMGIPPQARSTSQQPLQQPGQSRVDYEQAGIDFVLTLERPCMDHLPWLLERANEPGGEACGHALMASCPPEPFPELNKEIPFGYAHSQALKGEHQTWELSKADLATLLDLSQKLDLDGEITPVMAWGMILGHPRLMELTCEDYERLTDDLKSKVRCYGYESPIVPLNSNPSSLTNRFQVWGRDGGIRGAGRPQRCLLLEAGRDHGLLGQGLEYRSWARIRCIT